MCLIYVEFVSGECDSYIPEFQACMEKEISDATI